MSDHAKFSPSSAHRWMECAGSMLLERDLPQGGRSVYADEGTAAHWLAAECLRSGKNAAEHEGKSVCVPDVGDPYFVGIGERDGFLVDDAFASAVQVYLNLVRELAKGGDLYIEQRLELSTTLEVPNQFGTSDAAIANFDKKHLAIVDLKFGRGEQVYAERNYQMMLYALGVLETLEAVYGSGAFEHITLFICQPRLDWIDEWTVSYTELMEFRARARLATAGIEALLQHPERAEQKPEAYFSPSDKACRWCRAKANCKALAGAISDAMLSDFNAIDDGRALAMTPRKLDDASDEVLGRRMSILDMVDAWANAVRAEGERRVHAGHKILGSDGLPMKVVEGKKGNRAWTDKDVAEGALVGVLPPEKAYKPREIVSPSEAEKALGKPRFAEVMLPFVTQAPGKPSVVLGSDKRPPIVTTAKAEEFSDPALL